MGGWATPEARRAYMAMWREKRREHLREYEAKRYARIGEEKRAQMRQTYPAYYAANQEKIKARSRAYYAAHREQAYEAARIWKLKNPERAAATHRKAQATRRARKRGAFVEAVCPNEVLARSLSVCGICEEAVDVKFFHVDHIVALSRGGEHSYANTQAAHPSCNLRKGSQ